MSAAANWNEQSSTFSQKLKRKSYLCLSIKTLIHFQLCFLFASAVQISRARFAYNPSDCSSLSGQSLSFPSTLESTKTPALEMLFTLTEEEYTRVDNWWNMHWTSRSFWKLGIIILSLSLDKALLIYFSKNLEIYSSCELLIESVLYV